MIANANAHVRFGQLFEPGKRLLRAMQTMNFGRLTFRVRRGAPDFQRLWRTRRMVKLASGINRPRSEAALPDFELCREQTALLSTLRHVPDGTRVTVDVRHGLPFTVEIDQPHQAA